LLLAAVYMVAARAAFALGFVHTSIAPVWLPSGIALAAVLLFGRRAVLGVFLGAFLFNATTPVPLWVSAAIGVGNTLEAVAGAWLLRRAGFRREIDRIRDVLALAGLAALLATAISATVGVSSLWLSGTVSGGELRGAWAVWWLGDASGVLTVAPPLLLAGSAWGRRRRPALGRVLEAVALAATLVLVADAGLTGETARPFVVFPALVWAAVRFRQGGAALASLFVSAVVVWLSAHGHGPYVASSPTERFLLGQTSTGVVMATSLVLAALTVQRELAAWKLAERERQLAEAHTQAELSRRLQNGLLPVLSLRDPTLLLRTRYQPGQERALLGADLYDAVELPDRTVATLIGDVAGHGPDEAAVGVALRAAWQGLVLSGHGPAALLDGLDKVLVRNRPSEEMFTTVCCAWISPDRTQVTLALAGHPPPLLIRAGEVRVEEVPGGPALGIHDDGYAWEAKTLEVGHGWTLLCYTDGLVEGLQEPGSVERFGIDALVQAVSGLLAAGDDLDTVLDDLLVAVRRPTASRCRRRSTISWSWSAVSWSPTRSCTQAPGSRSASSSTPTVSASASGTGRPRCHPSDGASLTRSPAAVSAWWPRSAAGGVSTRAGPGRWSGRRSACRSAGGRPPPAGPASAPRRGRRSGSTPRERPPPRRP
jgi:integral membrane sensor domain MASE1